MWLILAFLSAMLLGFYDVAKKQALRDNSVPAVLLLNTFFSSLIFLPSIVSTRRSRSSSGTAAISADKA